MNLLPNVSFLFIVILPRLLGEEFCELNDVRENCQSSERYVSAFRPRYIFYDVNPPEGFNLRRDVFIRMASLAQKLKDKNFRLILPPWPHLYHWISNEIPNQRRLPWSAFFNITTMSSVLPVFEMSDFLQTGQKEIEQVYVLQHFKDMFTSGNFEDRFSVEPCEEPLSYARRKGDAFEGFFWGYENLTAKNVECLSFHGPATLLEKIISSSNAQTIMFDHAEVALHERFGDRNYWIIRKSMRFADHLINEADEFRKNELNSTVSNLQMSRGNNGTPPAGDDYICVHLRRRDFLYGRKKHVPGLKGAARQIAKALEELNLDKVFVATDAPETEKSELRSYLEGYKVVTYDPSGEIKSKFKDGGTAIIEQIICSHARKFYGTHESTFSFRIQEEREIMGFPPETTFNRICGDEETKCKPPSKWLIVN